MSAECKEEDSDVIFPHAGAVSLLLSAEELGRYMKSEFEKWGKLIADAGITVR